MSTLCWRHRSDRLADCNQLSNRTVAESRETALIHKITRGCRANDHRIRRGRRLNKLRARRSKRRLSRQQARRSKRRLSRHQARRSKHRLSRRLVKRNSRRLSRDRASRSNHRFSSRRSSFLRGFQDQMEDRRNAKHFSRTVLLKCLAPRATSRL
jgi:hypothetical protein